MEKKVTIHDIAREAGVSAATVSYVINDKQGQTISEETKNKISLVGSISANKIGFSNSLNLKNPFIL